MRGWISRLLSRCRTGMGKDLQRLLVRPWGWSQKGAREGRVAKERARFWDEVHKGEREAEAHSHETTANPSGSLDLKSQQ
jgi:hypothetical protein